MHIWFAHVLHRSSLVVVGTSAWMHAASLAYENEERIRISGGRLAPSFLHHVSQVR